MPDAGDTRAIYCPSCGASVEMEGDQGSCMYCGTVVERQASAGDRPRFAVTQVRLQTSAQSTYVTPAAAPRRSGALVLGIVMSAIFVAVGVGIGLFVANMRSGSTTTVGPTIATAVAKMPEIPIAPPPVDNAPPSIDIGSINELIAGLPRDGEGENLLVYINNPNDQGISVGLIDGGSRSLRWKSQPLSKDAYRGHLVAGVDMAYLTDQERLIALRLDDGTQAWEAKLIAEPNCDECLQLAGEHVIVAQKDGSITGFDGKSGQQAWNITLDEAPRRLPVVGKQLILLQPVEDNGKYISLIDPATGKETQRIEPSCPSTSFAGRMERPEDYSPLLFTPDAKTLYTTFGFFNKCAQRWDLAADKPTWTQALDEVAPPEWSSRDETLVSDDALFFRHSDSDTGALWALDTADGKLRQVAAKRKYEFLPVAVRDGVLIALTWPNWDTSKVSLLGLDPKSGEQRWEFKPQVSDARATEIHGHLDWRMTKQGLLLVQVLEDEAQLVTETLDPKTGTSSNRQVTSLEGMGSHVFWQALWSNDMAWLDIGSSVYAVDLNKGATVYRLD
ncbi:MAG TPA: PQQ-binding-like beta-propeller repeat protein [Roseiflexaceae bacterium]|nr:PQQ-binding-like beta-propeller repeat protein [Roseiflexaceae bacterium]